MGNRLVKPCSKNVLWVEYFLLSWLLVTLFSVSFFISVYPHCPLFNPNDMEHLTLNFTATRYKTDRVNSAPVVTEGPQNATVVLGATYTFKSLWLSDLHLNVQWLFGNSTILKVMVRFFDGFVVSIWFLFLAFLWCLIFVL